MHSKYIWQTVLKCILCKDKNILEKKKIKLDHHLITYLHKSCHQAQAAAQEKDSGSAPPLSVCHSHTDSLPSGKKGHLEKNNLTYLDKDYDQH